MGLSWNEIKSRALLFGNVYHCDTERMAFLFELYQRITSFLPAAAIKKTRIKIKKG
jgi:hypothetical protein